MPVSPAQHEAFAQEIRRIYADAETNMLESVAKRLARGIASGGWATQKLAEVQHVRRTVEAQLSNLSDVGEQIGQAVAESYQAGANAAVAELREIEEADVDVDTSFVSAHQQAVEALARTATQAVESTHLQILRSAMDTYRSVISETSAQVLTGTQTRLQAAQAALNRFADRGITGFVDTSGRRWSIESYAEMAVRSATGQAAVEGHVDRLQDAGRSLVIVSDSPDECRVCRLWEGKILTLGNDTGRVQLGGGSWQNVEGTLREARSAGLLHPNCTHSIAAVIPGLTKRMRDTANPMGDEDRQRQRAIERQIRKWKRRKAAALSDEERQMAQHKVSAWQAEMRAFLDDTGRHRKRNRESITAAR